MVNQNSTNDGTCDNTGCEEVTPWDMASIIVDDEWFCSPGCATEHLEEKETTPQSVTLHDPQFVLSRDEFPPTVGEADVNIQHPVPNIDDAFTTIQEIESNFPSKFRVVLEE